MKGIYYTNSDVLPSIPRGWHCMRKQVTKANAKNYYRQNDCLFHILNIKMVIICNSAKIPNNIVMGK